MYFPATIFVKTNEQLIVLKRTETYSSFKIEVRTLNTEHKMLRYCLS